jgi:hypothetical protein
MVVSVVIARRRLRVWYRGRRTAGQLLDDSYEIGVLERKVELLSKSIT